MQVFLNFLKSIFQAIFGKPSALAQPQPVAPVAPVVIAPVKPAPAPVDPKPKMLQAYMVRTYGQKETTSTFNLIRADGTFWTCKVLELPWLNNQHDVSCIPAGTYLCVLKPFHNVMRYELQAVPGRDAIFIHEGNYASGIKIDTEGCILLGSALQDINNDNQLDVIDSVQTVKKFMDELNNMSFTLTIK
jgi:hypothetical protein